MVVSEAPKISITHPKIWIQMRYLLIGAVAVKIIGLSLAVSDLCRWIALKETAQWFGEDSAKEYRFLCSGPALPASGPCLDRDFCEVDGDCYCLSKAEVPLLEAQKRCLQIGMNLATIGNEAANEAIMTNCHSQSPFWIGHLRDTGVWRWADETVKSGFTNWYDNEPSDDHDGTIFGMRGFAAEASDVLVANIIVWGVILIGGLVGCFALLLLSKRVVKLKNASLLAVTTAYDSLFTLLTFCVMLHDGWVFAKDFDAAAAVTLGSDVVCFCFLLALIWLGQHVRKGLYADAGDRDDRHLVCFSKDSLRQCCCFLF